MFPRGVGASFAYKGWETAFLKPTMTSNSCRIWSLLLLLVSIHSFTTSVQAKTVVVTVHTTVQVQATATAPSPASYTSTHEFKDTVLQVTNDYRKAHDAGPLVWNDTLAKYSHKWAQACIWKHSVSKNHSVYIWHRSSSNHLNSGWAIRGKSSIWFSQRFFSSRSLGR